MLAVFPGACSYLGRVLRDPEVEPEEQIPADHGAEQRCPSQ